MALILDVVGIARNGNVMAKEQALKSKKNAANARKGGQITTFLLARVAESRQIAVVLSHISRLEEIKASALERAGNQTVVQYRGYLMPLVWLNEVLGGRRSQDGDPDALMQVIVCSKNGFKHWACS